MLKIRIFQPSDIFPVIKIASDILTEQYNPSLFNFFYETFKRGFIVAEQNHKILGFIVGIKTENHTARILMLAVLEEYRRKKIGRKLLNKLIQEFINLSIKIVELEVKTENQKAIDFYIKNGFKIAETIPNFYQDGKDAHIMRVSIQL